MTNEDIPPPESPPEPSPAPTGSRHAVFHVALVVLVALAAAGAFVMFTGKKKAEAQEASSRADELAPGPRVQVMPVRVSPPSREVVLSGEVKAFRQATLYAKISGYLRVIRVDKGDTVKENEILGVIESPETERDIASHKADIALKKSTNERYQSLAKLGVVSQQERDVAAGQLEVAVADLARLRALQGYEVIRAPFAGVVTARFADPGALLQAATSTQAALPLVELSDMARVRVYVYPSQADASFLKEGDPVKLWTDERSDRTIDASITRLTRSLDVRTRTMLTEIDVDNRDGSLYPGAFLHARIVSKAPPALEVPLESVFFRAGKSMVAAIEGDRARFLAVETGDTNGKTVRVTSGLTAGQMVGLHVGDDVFDGGRVQAVDAPAPAGSASGSPVPAASATPRH